LLLVTITLNFNQLNLSDYISDLLYRHECVIVPGFGGFVTNTKSAIISPYSKTFYPPHKLVTFNSHLKNNDGLLVNYISAVDQVPYDHALNFIKFEIGQWLDILENTDLELKNIGRFSLDENNTLIFEPQTDVNYLTTSYGLSSFVNPEITRESDKNEVVQLQTEKPEIHLRKRESDNFLKYAAIFVIGLSLLSLAANSIYQKHQKQELLNLAQEHQIKTQAKIEQATFIVSDILPSIEMNVSLDKMPFHVVAGAFRYPENAQRLVNKLKENGYNARILGINKWGLTQVCYESYTDRNKAINNLIRIRETETEEAWLLIQDL